MTEVPVTEHEERRWSTLFDLLQRRVRKSPGSGVYVRDGRGGQEFRTYSQLLATAHRIAFGLADRGVEPGDAVLVAQPTSFEFLSTFFALQALGAVPIPLGWTATDDPFKGWSRLARWRRLATCYDARVLVCGELGRRSENGWAGVWPPYPLETVTDVAHLVEDMPTHVEVEAHAAAPSDVAYIQSTSGTTGAPRGVRLSHRGIYTNVEVVGRRIEARDDDVLVSWLPLDNIMGLVGVVFFALHWGIRPVLMHSDHFLEQPEDWFWAISDHRATLSLAPNSAFNYCVRRCNATELEGLDLSSWRIAMNGSEPVRAQHIQAFARRFHAYGLADHVIVPVYGLSEATLGVTVHPACEPIRIDGVNRCDLEREGEASTLPPEGAQTPSERMHVVSVGRPLDGIDVRIVDSQGEPVGERKLGEIAIRGPNVMDGYVESTVRDDDPLPSRLDGEWLLTGDLGYMADGDLFFVTRASDRIELESGRSVIPEEAELFVDAVDGVRAGSTAVFASPDAGDEEFDADGDDPIVVAFEVQAGADAGELIEIICDVLKTHLDLTPAQVVDLPVRSVPKTPTGKVRRHHCRRLMKRGLLGKKTAGLLHREVWNETLRDLGETVRASGASIVGRLRGLIPDD